MTRDGSGYWIGSTADLEEHAGNPRLFGDGCRTLDDLYPQLTVEEKMTYFLHYVVYPKSERGGR